MGWRRIDNELPKRDQLVWYYFEVTGVSAGFYRRNKYGDTFSGEHGFLTNDVTHWMPIDEYKPKPPNI